MLHELVVKKIVVSRSKSYRLVNFLKGKLGNRKRCGVRIGKVCGEKEVGFIGYGYVVMAQEIPVVIKINVDRKNILELVYRLIVV